MSQPITFFCGNKNFQKRNCSRIRYYFDKVTEVSIGFYKSEKN